MPAKAAATSSGEIGTAAAAAAAATAAAGPAWRQFSFFESSPVRDVDDFAKAPSALRNPNEVAAVCQCPVRPPPSALSNGADPTSAVHFDADPSASTSKTAKAAKAARKQPCTLVGTIQGKVKVLDPETYQELSSWGAFSSAGVAGRVTHLSCDARGRVVTLGEEDSSRFPILRIWDLRNGRNPSRQESTTAQPNGAPVTTAQNVAWMPRLLAEGKVQHGSRPHPIAAISHTPSLSYLSVALADGTVLLIRGLESALVAAASNAGIASPTSAARPAPATALPKFKVVFQPTGSDSGGAHEPVTALGFSEAAAPVAAYSTAASGTNKLNSASPAAVPAYEPRALHGSKGRKGAAGRPRDGRTAANANVGAAAAQPESTAPPSAVHLFIVTLSRVLRYVVVGKGAGGSPAVLDDVGGALGCAAVIPPRPAIASAAAISAIAPGSQAQSSPGSAGKMVIARDEAIYVIGQEGREACFAYEGPKSSIHLSASQVVIVSPPYTPSSSSTSRNLIGNRDSPLTTPTLRKGSMMPAEIAKVTIFDLDNKLVAFSGTFESGIREAWVGPAGEVLVLSDTGELTRLDEKPLRAKLDVLYRKSLFLLAVNLARSHMHRAANPDVLARTEALMGDIYQRYGDHLYNKGDYDGAMAQYVKTIGHTQPSFVIRRFLDAQRITNLTTYLQELHAQNLASSDHTTLLLNCYTKLKDVASLDKFIKRPHAKASAANADDDGADGEGDAGDRDELPFDLETAMQVCRQAGYFGHAAYLAKRYGEHREYLRVQIEDAKDYSDALLYVHGLDAEDAIASMAQYAKTLLSERPDETTELLIELCSGAFRPDPDAAHKAFGAQRERDAKKPPAKSAAAAYLSYLQVGGFGKTQAQSGGDSAAAGGGANSRAGTGTHTPAQRNSTATAEPYSIGDGNGIKNGTRPSSTVKAGEVDADASLAEADASGAGGDETDKMQAYAVPSPRTYFAHFIQHPRHFVRFLETVALARWGQVVDMDAEPSVDEKLAAAAAPAYSEKAEVEAEDDVERALRELGLDAVGSGADGYEDQEVLDQKSIWNTLLELYLSSSSSSSEDGAQQRLRALRLLEQHATLPYDASHAVMLCAMQDFHDGLILLYERMGMYEDVVRLHMDAASSGAADASGRVIAALHRYGSAQPELYELVLRFVVSSRVLLERHTADLLRILAHIRDRGLMSTLELVHMLASTPHTPVGVVRAFIVDSISATAAATHEDTLAIAQYAQSTHDALHDIAELTDAATARVFQMTRCTACGGQLDLPSVHFMCKHSFHQRCLGEEEAECASCAEHQRRVREARRRAAGEAADVVRAEREEGGLARGREGDRFAELAALFALPIMSAASGAQL
ncbi:related to PEP5-vacuolar biogenesis protein [Sporisorium reilianum SRZ2]|uniref:Related to PEP5-vacuolar biogenesis protein n=1 Tax=Sporisorium reilianum (strain SRZ2) TaxID=999809 RepID=E6ZMH5_SPORE|nr:related to PEP5-vacuolar biogenesis protein [Sporisorium reilianum SRZ2]